METVDWLVFFTVIGPAPLIRPRPSGWKRNAIGVGITTTAGGGGAVEVVELLLDVLVTVVELVRLVVAAVLVDGRPLVELVIVAETDVDGDDPPPDVATGDAGRDDQQQRARHGRELRSGFGRRAVRRRAREEVKVVAGDRGAGAVSERFAQPQAWVS